MMLIGIDNENEFYPAGFFANALAEELKAPISGWTKSGADNNPARRLARVAKDYLEMLANVRVLDDRSQAHQTRQKASYALLQALGYELKREVGIGEDDSFFPRLCALADADGNPNLWIIEAPIPGKDDSAADPLTLSFAAEQFNEDERELAATESTIEDALVNAVFSLKTAPRYILVLGLSQLLLIDRNKWANRAVLRFDLQEIFSAHEAETYEVMACFLARQARAPEVGIPLADRLEEEAQRHANAVTTSLKKTVRDAIEILGQEVLDVTEGKYKRVWIKGDQLSMECLRYMYRLLFLFYAEANPRLGVLDVNDPVYASGYSLEALRELESVRLRTIEEREGTYLWESLQRTLTLLYSGHPALTADRPVFKLPHVKVSLLDPGSTPILSSLSLRNEAIQKIIRLLSLKQTRKSTSRISYAQLGIGQLGAVYETLISFTGSVAKTDLIELMPQTGTGAKADEPAEDDYTPDMEGDEDLEGKASRKDKIDYLKPSYFVQRTRASEFKPEEVIYDGTQPRIYPKGTFIYRLSGRDRAKSASYYTPEPLARLLVKHALMERCKDLSADQLLELKILEPAMGSAAFLVETTNQIAELYLERKQKETEGTIAPEDYFLERQKVRAFIADRNCYGVDLNPVAVELGAISLWLNSLHDSDFSPWFGDQLYAGNSLIGARRASYGPAQLTAKKQKDSYFNCPPQEIGWRNERPEGHIWQFLLPAKDMAKFEADKSITEFAKDAQDRIKAWRKVGSLIP